MLKELADKVPREFAEETTSRDAARIAEAGQDRREAVRRTRLRRGAYGQRYDNAAPRRHQDDICSSRGLVTKARTRCGPRDAADQDSFGGLKPEQMELLADVFGGVFG